jgi:excinuclease ABC subunit C
MECYDISNTQGTNSVGAMVVFERGAAKKSDYRKFKIKTVEGANDFASLQEVLRRRFRRLVEDSDQRSAVGGRLPGKDDSWARVPDLVIIDGGKGQLSAAQKVLRELGIEGVNLIGLAKQEEEIFIPDRAESLQLQKSSEALKLLQRIRDEAHRFGITYHRKLRAKVGIASQLDAIPGIGPRRRRALLIHFGSIEKIRDASVEELLTVEGMSRAAAQKLKEQL